MSEWNFIIYMTFAITKKLQNWNMQNKNYKDRIEYKKKPTRTYIQRTFVDR